jgi:hypothetical protein
MVLASGPFPAQPVTKTPLHKRILAAWCEGWCVIGRLFHFLIYFWVAALPLAFVEHFVNPGNHAVFTNGVFNPAGAWDAALLIFWMPLAFVFASRMSGRLRSRDT